ncbi:TfoX/Sxy family protein [Pedobacter sp. L105]|uniref:TfoX/Sxy family protein n=1 Tax=Pedobacter sp. L105 TaxID=1641871 RepID=UPI00131E7BC1|nr:TfoX/Sxy family protein [Pedobacter sp. L105]
MAYQEVLVNRIRETLNTSLTIEEKEMFRGMCFMVDDKMCICTFDDEFLCRIGAEQAEIELEKGNCRQMVNGKTVMKDYVYVSAEDIRNNKDFNYWIDLCLKFNPQAKSSKKRPKT